MLPAKRPARLTVRLADGRVLTRETMTNRGDAADPYTPDEVRAKFFDLTVPVWGEAHAKRVHSAIETIETAESLAGLNTLLGEPPRKDA